MSSNEDLELLKLAAKASGNTVFSAACLGVRSVQHWNPLEDDGDAFRLAFSLGISISHSGGRHQVKHGIPSFDICELGGIDDARRSIVRIAAEIGRQML